MGAGGRQPEASIVLVKEASRRPSGRRDTSAFGLRRALGSHPCVALSSRRRSLLYSASGRSAIVFPFADFWARRLSPGAGCWGMLAAELLHARLGDFVLVDHRDILTHHALGDPREEGDLDERLPIAMELIDALEVDEVGIDRFGRVMDAAGDLLGEQSLQSAFHGLALVGQGAAQVVDGAAEREDFPGALLVLANEAADRGLTEPEEHRDIVLPENAALLVRLFQQPHGAPLAEVVPGRAVTGLHQILRVQECQPDGDEFRAPQRLVEARAIATRDGQPEDLAWEEQRAFRVEILEDFEEPADEAVGNQAHVFEAELFNQFAFEHVVQRFLGQRPVTELDMLTFVEGVHG